MQIVDQIPEKLLDCPEIRDCNWPEAFVRLGRVIRVDYSTGIHGPDEDGDVLRSYAHVFSSGVDVYVTALEGDDDRTFISIEPPFAPIVMGVVDRVLVGCEVDGYERVICYERKDAGDDVGDDADEVKLVDFSVLAWEPEGNKLVAFGMDGWPVMVLQGGFLGLTADAMITG